MVILSWLIITSTELELWETLILPTLLLLLLAVVVVLLLVVVVAVVFVLVVFVADLPIVVLFPDHLVWDCRRRKSGSVLILLGVVWEFAAQRRKCKWAASICVNF